MQRHEMIPSPPNVASPGGVPTGTGPCTAATATYTAGKMENRQSISAIWGTNTF